MRDRKIDGRWIASHVQTSQGPNQGGRASLGPWRYLMEPYARRHSVNVALTHKAICQITAQRLCADSSSSLTIVE